MYAKIINKQLQNAPDTFVTEKGIIINPTATEYLQRGYKRHIDDMPSYDKTTQRAEFVAYVETDTDIIATYRVVDYVAEPTDRERIEAYILEQDELLIDLDFRLLTLEMGELT